MRNDLTRALGMGLTLLVTVSVEHRVEAPDAGVVDDERDIVEEERALHSAGVDRDVRQYEQDGQGQVTDGFLWGNRRHCGLIPIAKSSDRRQWVVADKRALLKTGCGFFYDRFRPAVPRC